MLKQRYIDEIKLELENIHTVIKEAVNILTEFRDVEPDNIRITAAGSFLAQFYKKSSFAFRKRIRNRDEFI